MAESIDSPPDLDSNSIQFLVKEYEQINNERSRLKDEALKRAGFFITLTSAFVGGLAILDKSRLVARLEAISMVIFVFLLITGWHTLQYLISRDVSVDTLNRAQARIRRYFADLQPALVSYLLWPHVDTASITITKNTSAVRRTIQSMLSFIIAGWIALLTYLSRKSNVQAYIVGAVIGMLAYFALELFAQRQYKKAAKKVNENSTYKNQIPNFIEERKSQNAE